MPASDAPAHTRQRAAKGMLLLVREVREEQSRERERDDGMLMPLTPEVRIPGRTGLLSQVPLLMLMLLPGCVRGKGCRVPCDERERNEIRAAESRMERDGRDMTKNGMRQRLKILSDHQPLSSEKKRETAAFFYTWFQEFLPHLPKIEQ